MITSSTSFFQYLVGRVVEDVIYFSLTYLILLVDKQKRGTFNRLANLYSAIKDHRLLVHI